MIAEDEFSDTIQDTKAALGIGTTAVGFHNWQGRTVSLGSTGGDLQPRNRVVKVADGTSLGENLKSKGGSGQIHQTGLPPTAGQHGQTPPGRRRTRSPTRRPEGWVGVLFKLT